MKILYFFAAFLLVFCNAEEEPDYLLNDDVIPVHYDIDLTPFLGQAKVLEEQFRFSGSVKLTLRALKDNVNSITLHAKNLHGLKIKVLSTDLNPIKITSVTSPDSKTDKFTIKLDRSLEKDKDYVFQFDYEGQMDDDMHGFYRSNYTDKDNNVIWIGSTQFQTHHARRAFPCFDEPKFKAKFTISITCHKNYTAISNTRLQGSAINLGESTAYYFEKTPIMSTYLVAFLVSNFEKRENVNKDFAIISRPEAINQTKFSLDIGQEILKKFDEYTLYPYSDMGLKKMDLAAIPDFSAGAMENWGLLTYRETGLLHEASHTTMKSEQSIAAVIAHEQAHMWFGDLVTCHWWSYTWLNEGFARFFQYFMTHEVKPEWEMDKQFVVEQLQSVMVMDSLGNTHPMSDPSVRSPEDLKRMFGSISYNKGASFIRMLQHAMGKIGFKKGIQKYLVDRQFQTSEPHHLISGLTRFMRDTANFNLTEFVYSWTTRVGYPVVTVTLNKNKRSITVTQKRFLLQKDAGDAFLKYIVPITFTTNVEKDFSNTTSKVSPLRPESESETFQFNHEAEWVIANIQQTGYYRVNYDKQNWENIRTALLAKDHSDIHPINRAQIVDDLLNFGRQGLLEYDFVFYMLEYLETEKHYLPWYSAFTGITYLATRLEEKHLENFQKYIHKLVENIYKHLSFNQKTSDTRLDTYNRATVLTWACKYNYPDCNENAKNAYEKLKIDSTPVPVNIRGPVYHTAVRDVGENAFNDLWKKYNESNVAAERVLILGALGCTKEEKLIHTLLNFILKDVRLQDRSSALSSTYSSHPGNLEIVYKFVKENPDQFEKSFGSKEDVASILSGIASKFTKQQQRDDLANYLKSNTAWFGNTKPTIEKALKTVDENLKWSKEFLPKFIEYINGASQASFSVTLAVVLATILKFVAY